MRKRIQHRAFQIALLAKMLDGLLELIGGLLLWSVSPATIGRLTVALTQHELAEDPRDFVANYLVAAASRVTNDVKLFAVLYLLAHGLTKIVLMIALLRGHTKAYPWAIAFLALFIGYQSYRVSYSGSGLLAAFTVIDVVVVLLIWREYRERKRAAMFGP